MKLAIDSTSRRLDDSGFLHVVDCALTIAAVNDYYGHEVPGHEELGLDPDTLYGVLRPVEELEKAVGTYDGVPILITHKADSAIDPQKALRIGATGSSAKWVPPHIRNTISFHDATAIELINLDEQRELSAGYSYDPVLESGTFDGKPYKIKMTNIRCNHIALVVSGRAGPTVTVADSRPTLLEGLNMRVSKALGAMLTRLPGFTQLAQDEGIEVEATDAPPETPGEGGGSEVKELVAAVKALLSQVSVEDDEVEGTVEVEDDETKAKAEDDEAEADKAVPKAMDQAAIVRRVTTAVEAKFAAKIAAATAVAPLVGSVIPSAFDSAEAIYGFALDHVGIDTSAHPAGSYKGMTAAVLASRKPAVLASDATPSGVMAGFDLSRFEG